MINLLIKLANDLDQEGNTGSADKVDSLIGEITRNPQEIADKIAKKINETKPSDLRARWGTTAPGIGDMAILIGYKGEKDGIPGNAGDTVSMTIGLVQKAIDALGLTKNVLVKGCNQQVITGSALGFVFDSSPPAQRPASYQVDIVALKIL